MEDPTAETCIWKRKYNVQTWDANINTLVVIREKIESHLVVDLIGLVGNTLYGDIIATSHSRL